MSYTNLGVKHGGSEGAGQHTSHVEEQQTPPPVHHLQRHTHKQSHHHIRQQVHVSVGGNKYQQGGGDGRGCYFCYIPSLTKVQVDG